MALAGGLLLAQSSQLERAWKLAGDGDRAGAEQLLNGLLEREHGNVEARLLYGSLLADDGKREAALEQLQSAVKLRPRSPEAWNTLGETYRHFEDKGEAREAFERAIAVGPKFGLAQSNLGAALLEEGKATEAAPHLDQAITLLKRAEDLAEARYLRGRMDLDAGRVEAARKQLEQAVALRPDFAEAWSDLGQTRRSLLDGAGALEAFERAVKLAPEDAVAQYRLGAEYLRQEKVAEAVRALEAAYRLNREDQSVLNALASALRKAGRRDEAEQVRRELSAAIEKRDRASQNALRALKLNNEGVELEKAGQLAEAEERYRQAVELNPEHAGMRVNHAAALLRLGRWRDGLEEMHTGLERDPKNENIRAALEDALRQAPKGEVPEWGRDRR